MTFFEIHSWSRQSLTFLGIFCLRKDIKGPSKSPGLPRQTHHLRLSTCLRSSQCVSQLLLSSLSRSSRSPPSLLLCRLGMATSTTKAKMVEARITTTATRARMAAVATAPGSQCLSTRMISRDGTRASTPRTSTRKLPRSTSRSNVRASARRMTGVTLARLTRVMRGTTNSSASCLSRSSTSTPGRKTVMMARMTTTTRMERRTTRRMTRRKTTRRTTRSTTTLLPGTPTTDT
ncbi:hypothetical protein IW262DRAFT_1488695, partial [Armillaria fumosa]